MSGAGPSGRNPNTERTTPYLRSHAQSERNSPEAQRASPSQSTRSHPGGFSRLPRVAGLSSRGNFRGNGRNRGQAKGRARRSPSKEVTSPNVEEPPVSVTIAEEGWAKIREIIQEELEDVCSHVFAQKLVEAVPSIEEIAQSEARLLTNDVQTSLVDRMNDRFDTTRQSQETDKIELRSYVDDVVRRETLVYTKKIEELEKTISELRASQQQQQPVFLPPPVRPLPVQQDKDEKQSRHSGKKSRRSDDKQRSSRRRKEKNHRRSDSDLSIRRSSSDSDNSEGSSRSSTPSLSPTLSELNPSNSRFKKVLSYKTYLLNNSDQRMGAKVCKRVASHTKRMGTSIPNKFDGKDPISVLKFLALFKRAADNNDLSEGAAYLVLPNFLSGKASVAFNASLHADAVHQDSGGIQNYAEAVQWLLRTYAKDRYIQEAINKIREIRQKSGETEMEYGDRLVAAYSRFAGVYSQSEQINQYIENLSEMVSYDVIRERQTRPGEYLTLQNVIELADSFGQSLRARRSAPLRGRPTATRVLNVESNDGEITPMFSTESTGYTTPCVLPIQPAGTQPSSAITIPSYSTDTEMNNVYNGTQSTPNFMELSTPGTSQLANNSATALPVMTNMNPRLEAYAQPYRPGWKQSFMPKPANAEQTAKPTRPEFACFLCAKGDHLASDCPNVSEPLRQILRQNLEGATPAQRRHLPRWTYQLARVPIPGDHPTAEANHRNNGQQAPTILKKGEQRQANEQGKAQGA